LVGGGGLAVTDRTVHSEYDDMLYNRQIRERIASFLRDFFAWLEADPAAVHMVYPRGEA